MSFGFSVGDFIATLQLVLKATSLVQNAPGDYQELVTQLQTLQYALDEVREIGWLEAEKSEASAIQMTVQQCNASLLAFRNKMKDYDASLGRWSNAGKLRRLKRKLMWGATGQAENAQRLQQELAGYVGCLNMALQVYNIKKTHQQHVEVREALGETCRELSLQLLYPKNETESSLFPSLKQDIKSIPGRLRSAIQRDEDIPEVRFNPLYGRIGFQAPIILNDAMGRRIPIPSEYNIGLVQVVLCFYFQTGPGRDCVEGRYYDLFYSHDKNRKLSVDGNAPLIPGSSITMAIWVSQRMSSCCPKKSCPGGQIAKTADGGCTW